MRAAANERDAGSRSAAERNTAAATVPADLASPEKLLRRAIDAFRVAPWLTRRRLMAWAVALTAIWAAFLVVHIGTWASGRLVDDFVNYFAGAHLAAQGRADQVYDHTQFHRFESEALGPSAETTPRDPLMPVRIYSYPPTALLLSLPLALFGLLPGLVVWSVLGNALCFELLRRLADWRAAGVAMAAAPAAFFNLQSGQNGCYTAALLAGGMMLLDRAPVLAGMSFGCLAYKPQMAFLLPFALAAGGHWRAIGAAAVSAALLVGASWVAFGTVTWIAFEHQMAYERYLLNYQAILWVRMPTIFAAARQLGIAVPVADGAQAFSAILAVAATIAIWRGPASSGVKSAALCVATFLATPYALDYDAVVLIFAAAWLADAAQRDGFLPWERLTILALVVLPLPMVLLARIAAVPIGPVVLWPAFLVVFRRCRHMARGATGGGLQP